MENGQEFRSFKVPWWLWNSALNASQTGQWLVDVCDVTESILYSHWLLDERPRPFPLCFVFTNVFSSFLFFGREMTNRRCARGGKEKKGVAGVDAIVTHFSGCSNVV
jgi:hypothetical protein